MKRLFRAIRKAVENMAVIYAALIIKGKKTIDDVPAVIREKVRQIQEVSDAEKLRYSD